MQRTHRATPPPPPSPAVTHGHSRHPGRDALPPSGVEQRDIF